MELGAVALNYPVKGGRHARRRVKHTTSLAERIA